MPNYLHTRFASGGQFTAGPITTGSVIGVSGINQICERINSITIFTGSILSVGSIWVPSGTNSTQILASDNDRIIALIFNFGGSRIWIGSNGVTSITGKVLNSFDTYILRSREGLHGNFESSTGSMDIRYYSIK